MVTEGLVAERRVWEVSSVLPWSLYAPNKLEQQPNPSKSFKAPLPIPVCRCFHILRVPRWLLLAVAGPGAAVALYCACDVWDVTWIQSLTAWHLGGGGWRNLGLWPGPAGGEGLKGQTPYGSAQSPQPTPFCKY